VIQPRLATGWHHRHPNQQRPTVVSEGLPHGTVALALDQAGAQLGVNQEIRGLVEATEAEAEAGLEVQGHFAGGAIQTACQQGWSDGE
jgi:hypothetical protein